MQSTTNLDGTIWGALLFEDVKECINPFYVIWIFFIFPETANRRFISITSHWKFEIFKREIFLKGKIHIETNVYTCIFERWFRIITHDIGLICSSGEIPAENCLHHVIWPYIIISMIYRVGVNVDCRGLGFRKGIQGHLKNVLKKSRDNWVKSDYLSSKISTKEFFGKNDLGCNL